MNVTSGKHSFHRSVKKRHKELRGSLFKSVHTRKFSKGGI